MRLAGLEKIKLRYRSGSRGLGGPVVSVAARVAAVEGRPVVAVERQALAQPLGQIRVGDEVASERDEVGISGGDDGLRQSAVEAAGGDQGARELRPQMLGRDGRLAVSDLLGALDARLDHVQIRDVQAIELRIT